MEICRWTHMTHSVDVILFVYWYKIDKDLKLSMMSLGDVLSIMKCLGSIITKHRSQERGSPKHTKLLKLHWIKKEPTLRINFYLYDSYLQELPVVCCPSHTKFWRLISVIWLYLFFEVYFELHSDCSVMV